MKLMKNTFWKSANIFTLPLNLFTHRIAKITIDVLLRQEMPDKNHPLGPVIWMIVPGDLEALWEYSQPGHPDKIAPLALNSAIFSLLLLSGYENVGQRKAVDVLLKSRFRFTLQPSLSQFLTHWMDVSSRPYSKVKSQKFHSSSIQLSVCPVRTNTC